MMKHLFMTTLLATACTLGASAQSIKVTDAKGVAYKFAAERVRDITFAKVNASDVIDFSSITARAYSSGAVEATFSSADSPKTVTLWIVGPSMGKYLYDGVYTVSSAAGAMTIDAAPSYSFVKENGASTALKSGVMNVAISGKEYTITFDLILADDSGLKGKYIGEMPGTVGKDFTLPVCEAPTVKTTEVNDYVKGEFYVKMNDAAWSYEMVIDFFADANATKLPAGTYTYATDKSAGTFGTRSSIDIYNPSCNYKFATGSTVRVSYDGDNIVMEIALVTTDGRKIDMTYRGAIAFPAPASSKGALTASVASATSITESHF